MKRGAQQINDFLPRVRFPLVDIYLKNGSKCEALSVCRAALDSPGIPPDQLEFIQSRLHALQSR